MITKDNARLILTGNRSLDKHEICSAHVCWFILIGPTLPITLIWIRNHRRCCLNVYLLSIVILGNSLSLYLFHCTMRALNTQTRLRNLAWKVMENLVCSRSLMALLIRSVGGLSKCFYQGLLLADLNADVIGQSILRCGVAWEFPHHMTVYSSFTARFLYEFPYRF